MMNLPSLLFIDTSFFIALANNRDTNHSHALKIQTQLSQQTVEKVTSEYVLFELGNGLSRLKHRVLAQEIIELIRNDNSLEIVPATSDIFEQALQLFYQRPDKEWGLTDCASFVIMEQRGITHALTGDHHFEQAGFQILLNSSN